MLQNFHATVAWLPQWLVNDRTGVNHVLTALAAMAVLCAIVGGLNELRGSADEKAPPVEPEPEPKKKPIVGVPDENGNMIICALILRPPDMLNEIKRQQQRRRRP